MKRPALVLLAAGFIGFAGLSPLMAQVQSSRWGSVKALEFGSVNRATLDNHLVIPLFSRPTGVRAQASVQLVYDSQHWAPGINGAWTPGPGFGWKVLQPFGQIQVTQDEYDQYCGWYQDGGDGSYDQWYNLIETSYTFVEPDGTVVSGTVMPYSDYLAVGGGTRQRGDITDCPYYPPGSASVVLPDGKGYTIILSNQNTASPSAAAFDAAGDEIDGELKDANGNLVTSSTAGGVTSYFDPLSAANGNAAAVTESASGSTASFTYTGGQGSAVSVNEQLTTLNVTTSFGCGTHAEWSGTATVPSELDLPDGTKYLFAYDGDARLSAVTLPTGATIHYSYTMDCSSGATDSGNDALARWDSVNGPGAGWNWSRAQQGAGEVQTIETDPYGNDGVYAFAAPQWPGESGALTSAALYSGSHGSGAELASLAISNQITAGYVSGETSSSTVYGPPKIYRYSSTAFDSYGARQTESDYDWSATAPGGGLLRQSTTTFDVVNGVADLPASVVVADGSGTAAETTYSRDSRGNLLSENDYTSASAYLTKSFTYNANGTVATATDANGAVTNYTYGASGCGLFPAAIASQPIPAVQSSVTWDCVGGVPLTQTGANNDKTSLVYNDPLWRVTQVTTPDGTATNVSYTATTVERAMAFNSGNSTEDVLSTLDALGEPLIQQKRQAPGSANFDSVETYYDAMGRPMGVTVPYTAGLSAGAPAGTPQTVTTYDALSRPLVVTDGGGGTLTYTYAGNDVLSAIGPAPSGENPKQKQEEFGGLGRLESVCELTAAANGGGSCAQTNAVTGYWTKYTRNPLGEVTQVVQNAQGSPTETRSFGFDWLGRMTSETNPETGTSSYVYDTAACGETNNGDLIERQDAAGNVTCYAHDLLHRLTVVTYPSGPNASVTPSKHFTYDAATVDGVAMQGVRGRLAEAYTADGSGNITDEGFSYMPLGWVQNLYQWSRGANVWHTVGVGYYANGLVGNLNLDSLPQFWWWPDAEGRFTGAGQAGLSNNLALVSQRNPSGQILSQTLYSGDKDNFGYDATTGRMTSYQFGVGSQTDTGTLTWNANGSLASLQISDQVGGTSDSQTCNYSHDDLGRLHSVNCGTGQPNLILSFDPFGNLLSQAGSPVGLTTSFAFSNNRISGENYDSDGNLLDDPVIPATGVNAFDAEGHAVKFENASVVYDALGRAVEVNGTWQFVYGPGGRKLAVMNGATLARADIPLPGGDEAVFNASGLAYFRRGDRLGSSRLSSTPTGTVYAARAYTPYGAPYDESGGSGDRDFTGARQDIAPNKYDFLFREYEPLSGRWFTPDPAGLAAVDPNNPQSWNRYAYVGNRPLSLIDPLGLDGCTASSKLNALPNPNSSTIATSSADFGPYDSGSGGGSDASAGEDGGTNCIDGVDVGDLLDEMISEGGGGGSSSADVCPSGCETDVWVNNNSNDPSQGGHWQYVQYEGFAGAAANASGYYNPNDLANGVHDLDGKIYNDTGYAQQAKYDSYLVCESLSATVASKGSADCTHIIYNQGGHYNYAFTCQVAACAGRWPGGVHIEQRAPGQPDIIHFDSASPYIGTNFNLDTFNPFDFIQHVLADVVYGSICNCVLPH